jgi:thiosulfate reductase cytochrome b subunit
LSALRFASWARPRSAWVSLPLLAAALGWPLSGEAQQAVNPIHPAFVPLDGDGRPALSTTGVSADRTCGACHDAVAIASHSRHAAPRTAATCLHCHLDQGLLVVDPNHLDAEGKVQRDALRIGRPKAANCGRCHGVVGGVGVPVLLPPDFELSPSPGHRSWSLTQGEGAVISPTRMSESLLNLEGKEQLTAAWDVHAAKLVDCVACHAAPNDPARAEAGRSDLKYVRADPRRLSTAEFLMRPDHRLTEADCRTCHVAQETHDFLPYRARHLEVLACAACHAPGPRGPAAEMVDATVATSAGGPLISWRNVDQRPGEPLNAASLRPLRPLLVLRTDASGAARLTPINLVSRFTWVSGAARAPVPFEDVRRAWFIDGKVAPAVLAALDVDRDGVLDALEQRLDTPAKARVIAERLSALGFGDARIVGVLEAHALAHGIPGRTLAVKRCAECHTEGGRLAGEFSVAPYLPGGTLPTPPDDSRLSLAGTLEPTPEGGLSFARGAGRSPSGLHVLGRSRQSITNTLGFSLFLAVLLSLLVHGLVRVLLSRRHPRSQAAPANLARSYVFGLYERLWHWTMAGSATALMLTGLVIHSPSPAWPVGMATAVTVHNAAAVVLMVNAFLSLFHHVATAALRNFIPSAEGLLRRILEHVQYQARDIFFGGPHPRNAPNHKLNPLQQLTYLALLNILFPLQIGTGLLMWAVGHWPLLGAGLGGLSVLAPVHNLGSWLFLTFFVLHVYLITTGRTVGEHLTAMVTGYQLAEPRDPDSKGA